MLYFSLYRQWACVPILLYLSVIDCWHMQQNMLCSTYSVPLICTHWYNIITLYYNSIVLYNYLLAAGKDTYMQHKLRMQVVLAPPPPCAQERPHAPKRLHLMQRRQWDLCTNRQRHWAAASANNYTWCGILFRTTSLKSRLNHLLKREHHRISIRIISLKMIIKW